jgi:hypothetical protein
MLMKLVGGLMGKIIGYGYSSEKKASLHTIEKKNRVSEVLKKWLGPDFSGAIGCNCGTQQKCMTHLLRATKEISEKGTPEAVEFHKKN